MWLRGHRVRSEGVPEKITSPPASPPFRPEVDDPVRSPDHVEIVFDDHQRMALVDEAPQRSEEGGDVVEVKPGGGFVKEEKGAAVSPRTRLAGLGEVSGELEPLCLAAAQGGNGLPELHVLQANRHQRLERTLHFRLLAEEGNRLRRGHREHVGDRAGLPFTSPSRIRRQHRDLEHLGAVAPAVTVGTAQVDIAQELHFDVLESTAPAGRAAPRAGVETESSRGVSALGRKRVAGEHLANCVQGADVARRVGTGGLPDGGLVDHHHVPEPLVAADLAVRARRIRCLARELAKSAVADVFDQRRLARTAHPGDADETT